MKETGSIVFVCMGNICRSPVVEAVARAEFARAGLHIRVASAGTENYHIGSVADKRSIASARVHGYDVTPHRARQVNAAMFAEYDAVLVMDRVNLRDLGRHCPPQFLSKTGLFLAFAGIEMPHEVPDPYYGDASDFERVIELAQAGVHGLIRRAGLAHNAAMPVNLSSSA
jgi:protein-tyrosine phosphatase